MAKKSQINIEEWLLHLRDIAFDTELQEIDELLGLS